MKTATRLPLSVRLERAKQNLVSGEPMNMNISGCVSRPLHGLKEKFNSASGETYHVADITSFSGERVGIMVTENDEFF